MTYSGENHCCVVEISPICVELNWSQFINPFTPHSSALVKIVQSSANQSGISSRHTVQPHLNHTPHTVQSHHLANWPDRVSRLGLPRPGKVLSNVKQNIALRRYYTNMRNNLASCFRDFGRKFVGSQTYGANIMPYYGANASLYTNTEIWGQKIW